MDYHFGREGKRCNVLGPTRNSTRETTSRANQNQVGGKGCSRCDAGPILLMGICCRSDQSETRQRKRWGAVTGKWKVDGPRAWYQGLHHFACRRDPLVTSYVTNLTSAASTRSPLWERYGLHAITHQ
ncbi:hypothetical protein J6590_040336 [Homalodisca vitripennis]|nr:hypothetical protein J6590_040336 [Homalodisca vitripennis]